MSVERPVLIRVSRELMELIATRDERGNRLRLTWGEPDDDGFHSPTITIDESDNNARALSRAARDFAAYVPFSRLRKGGMDAWKRLVVLMDRADADWLDRIDEAIR